MASLATHGHNHWLGARIIKLLLACYMTVHALSGWADTLEGKVVAIADGDTVTVLDAGQNQHKIRLAGIDAPEKGQPWGQRSKESLSDLVFNHAVSVEWHKRDKYGRLVGKILVNGQDANLTQITRGLAWHYKEYQREQLPEDRERYAAAEMAAHDAKRGLWAATDPLPPWSWRKMKRNGISQLDTP